MNSNNGKSNEKQDITIKENDYAVKSNTDLIFNLLSSLPLHFKVVLYAFIKAYETNPKKNKVTVDGIFIEYQKISNELKIDWLSVNRVTDILKELENYGFLKCKYVRKGSGQIRYIDMYQPAEVSRYNSALRKDLFARPSPLISQGE